MRFFGVDVGSNGSISTIQPKRFASFGSLVTSKRSRHLPQAYHSPAIHLYDHLHDGLANRRVSAYNVK